MSTALNAGNVGISHVIHEHIHTALLLQRQHCDGIVQAAAFILPNHLLQAVATVSRIETFNSFERNPDGVIVFLFPNAVAFALEFLPLSIQRVIHRHFLIVSIVILDCDNLH